jgi:colanic acid biosynthesis glycosyl transferase WcaI
MSLGAKRLIIHDYGGYPFTLQLARSLASRGHSVLYLYGGREPRADISRRDGDGPEFAFKRLDLDEPRLLAAGLHRLLQERRYGRVLAEEIRGFAPDAVVSANCPLDAQACALEAAHAVDAAFIAWVQDIYSVAVGKLLGRRIPGIGQLIGLRFRRLERSILRSSEAVILIAEDFRPTTRAWGIADDRTFVIENWAPLDEVRPLPRNNKWAARHRLGESPVFLYAGTLGRKHNPRLLVQLAVALPTATVVVASEGTGTELLRGMTAGHPNLVMLPLQPASELPAMLASADVLLVILENDAGEFSIPSKVLTYLAAGRPILAAIPKSNLAAQVIEQAGAGIVVDPTNNRAFSLAARSLLQNPHARMEAAASARGYAVAAFDIGSKTDEFETVIETASSAK